MEEEEICRVCRSESTPDQPLFHPCKCAGSIRYVHQDCLTQWLSHSGKSGCELCNHKYTFTPVYQADMPNVLPARLFLQQLQQKLVSWTCLATRAVPVTIVWTIILPYFTVWIWRFLFWLGAHWATILGHTLGMALGMSPLADMTNGTAALNSSKTTPNQEDLILDGEQQSNIGWLEAMTHGLNPKQFLADCFEGQIIACFTIIVGAAAYLLHEWISHNLPADLAEDDDEANELEQGAAIDPQPGLIDHNENNTRRHLQAPEQDRHGSPVDRERFRDDALRLDVGDAGLADPDRIPSPVAPELPMWSAADPGKTLADEDDMRRIRASSMPAESSSSRDPGAPTTHDDERWRRTVSRAASEEPWSDLSRHTSSRANAENGYHLPAIPDRGHPPRAPILGHAETPDPQPVLQQPDIERARQIEANMQNHAQDEPEEDLDDENLVDEFTVLELIGWKSLRTLAYNLLLVLVCIAVFLVFAVCIPYLVGILFVMSDMFALVHLARVLTDPIIDLVISCLDYARTPVVSFYERYCSEALENGIYTFVPLQISTALVHLESMLGLSSQSAATLATDTGVEANLSWIDSFYALVKVVPSVDDIRARFHSIATNQTSLDCFLCILLGYGVMIAIFSVYLSRTPPSEHSRFKLIIRQVGMVLKVTMFIGIELLLFPIMCGLLLDLSALSLLSITPLTNRIAYLHAHPFSTTFLHWFLGTGFMFLFAILVTICRENVRPGVMWFIRDHNDAQFHPIKEIVKRPVLTLLQKIGGSGIMYTIVIVVGVGGVVYTIGAVTHGLLPLRWNLSKPLSVVPFDLIAAQVLIPAVIDHYEPKRVMKDLFSRWMTLTCRVLRLSSYMLGMDMPSEQGTIQYKTWKAWLLHRRPRFTNGRIHSVETDEFVFTLDGQLVRAPRHDAVPFIPGRRMLIPVDPVLHEPLDELERQLGHPASSAHGGDASNTVIVYTPPHFKLRVWTFMLTMWITGSMAMCAVILLPLALGRTMFGHITKDVVHDMYSFLLGAFLMLGTGLGIKKLLTLMYHLSRQPTLVDVARFFTNCARSLANWTLSWAFVIGVFGALLPVMIGLVVEFLVFLPLQEFKQGTLSVEVFPLWSRGFSCMMILHGVVTVLPANPWQADLDQTLRDGIVRINVKRICIRIVAPIIVACFVVLLMPFIMALTNIYLLGGSGMEGRIIRLAYTIVMVGTGLYYLPKVAVELGQRWADTVRDENYLERRQLHNLEEEVVL